MLDTLVSEGKGKTGKAISGIGFKANNGTALELPFVSK